MIARGKDICFQKSQEELVTVVKAKDARELDFDFKAGMIYWYDFTDKTIYKTQFDKGDKTVVIGGELHVGGLAVDWIYDHIYWSNTKLKTIEVANLDGTKRETIILKNNNYDCSPTKITIDPIVGWMFYLNQIIFDVDKLSFKDEYGRYPVVHKTYRYLPDEDPVDSTALTLDVVNQRIYYIVNTTGIYSVDYNLKI